MNFEGDYKSLKQYAEQRIRNFNLPILADDLINDAFINLHNTPYDYYKFLEEIKRLSFSEKEDTLRTVEINKPYSKSTSHFTVENTCVVCKQTKPASEFRIVKYKYKSYQRTECKSCEKRLDVNKKDRNKRWYEANKNSSYYKLKNKISFKRYVTLNRDSWNKYLRERQDKEKEALTDTYIKKLLRMKYSNDYILLHPELIQNRRDYIIKKKLAKSKKQLYI